MVGKNSVDNTRIDIANSITLAKNFVNIMYTRKCPLALSSPSGEAAEDAVVEGEKFLGRQNYG